MEFGHHLEHLYECWAIQWCITLDNKTYKNSTHRNMETHILLPFNKLLDVSKTWKPIWLKQLSIQSSPEVSNRSVPMTLPSGFIGTNHINFSTDNNFWEIYQCILKKNRLVLQLKFLMKLWKKIQVQINLKSFHHCIKM